MKKTIAICLAVLMLVSMLPLNAFATGVTTNSSEDVNTKNSSTIVDTWDGRIATSFSSGDGSESNPYVVKTAEQLAYFATLVNGSTFGNSKVILANNVDVSGYSWTPIGKDSSHVFDGVFNGNGYTVSGLEITSSSGVSGLFGYVSGTIENLNVNVYNVNISYGSGDIYLGAVASYNTGYILDVDVSGNLGAKNANSSTAVVHCGGVAGYNGGVVGRSHYNGNINVTTNGSFIVGGIVGKNEKTIYSSYSNGKIDASKTSSSSSYVFSIAGGITGGNSGTIKNCYSTLNVSTLVSAATSNSIAGGIAGEAMSDASIIINCYALGTVYASATNGVCAEAGGILGYARGYITNCYANNTVKALTNNATVAYLGKLFAGNTCTVSNSYVNASSSFERTESYNYTVTEGSGCNTNTVPKTGYRSTTTNPSNTTYTGTYTYSRSFVTDTLKWGTYVNVADHLNNVDHTWVVEDGRPVLHTERIYSLTINYHKDNLINKVAFFWKNANEQYLVETPGYIGYTADKTIVSGSMLEDTIVDVTYEKNYHYLNINYKSSDGKSLGSYSGRFGYGDVYSHTIPEKTGYTARESVIKGTMLDSDITVDTIYDANEYTLTIKYVYSDTNEVAAEEKQISVKYGSIYSVASPVIEGYNVSQSTVSGTMQPTDKNVTVYYGTNTHKITIINRYENGEEFSSDSYALSYGKAFSYDVAEKEGYTPSTNAVSGVVYGDKIYYVTYSPNSYQLTVNYVYAANGTQAAQSHVSTVVFGDAYSVTSPVLAGYTVSKDVVSGTMPNYDVTETVIYGNNMYSVRIRYQYSDGALIKEELVKVEYGTEYSIASPSIKWYTPDKFFISGTMPAYEISETVTYTRNIVNDGAGVCGNSASWILYEDGSLIISGQGAMYDYAQGAAPWYSLRSNITKIIIEDGITTIGTNAFLKCDEAKSVSLPQSIISIGDNAFFGCDLMTDVAIPQNVATIGDAAFSGCDSLSAIKVVEENSNFIVECGVLLDASKERLITYPMGLFGNAYDVPKTVKTIAPYAFYGNEYLANVTLPGSVTTIGASAFENCNRIEKIHITSSNVAIGEKAFFNSSITTLIVDGNVSFLGNYAFACSTIRSAYFKADVPNNVGDYVFGSNSITLERLCVYYPLENESWVSSITVVSNNTGYKSEYWRGYHAFAFNGILDVTFDNAGGEQVYATFVYCDKTPVSGVEVTFNSVTKVTDADGFVYFVYKDVEKVDLMIHKDNYFSMYETSTAYILKAIGVDYFNLTTDSSVAGVSCYGNNISSDIAYINVKYEGLVPVIVQATTAFDVVKMELVQEVKDSKNPSETYIKKVLQTVYKGDDNLSTDGRCRFMIEASAFAFNNDEDYPIYAYMYTSSGEDAVVEKLNIRTISFKFTGDFGNLFGDVSLKLSDTGVSFLDGISLKLKSPVDCPLSFKVVNNEVYITWDMDDVLDEELSKIKTEVEGTTTNFKDAISDTNTRVKNCMTKMSYKADEKLNKSKLFKANHTPDFSLQTSMAGGVCIVMGQDNSVQTVRSYLKLAVELKASWTADYIIVFVPITLEVKASATGEIEIQGLGFDAQKSEILMPDYTISTEASVQLSVGLGCRVLSAGVFGRIKLKSTIVIGEVTYFDGLVLSGEYGIYAKLNVGLFQLYGEKSWKFMEVELIPKISTASFLLDESETGYLGEYNGLPVYDVSAYSLGATSIDIDKVEWTTDISKEIEENSYEYSNAKIIEYDGIIMVMYLTISNDRNSYNAQSLVYRIFNKDTGEWSEPAFVNDNGTGDSSFTCAEYNGSLYVAYTETNKIFADDYAQGRTDEEMIIDTSLAQEVVVGVFNKSTNKFDDFRNLSNNNHFDSMPTMGVINNKLYVAWCTNRGTDNSIAFGMNRENNIYLSTYDGTEWSAPNCIVSDCNPVSEMVLVELDGNVNVAMIIDEDANYYTNDDSNIYIADGNGSVTFVDCYGDPIENLQTCIYQGKTSLVWYCGGGLKRLVGVGFETEMILEQTAGITSDYQIANLSDQILVLTWSVKNVKSEGSEVESSIIYKKFMDESNKWTDEAVALQVPYYLMHYDLNGSDGDIKFVFTNTNVFVDEDANETKMRSKLFSHFFSSGYSFDIGEFTNIKNDPNVGTVSMDAEITNTGVKTIKQVSVLVKQFNADTTTISRYYAVGVYRTDLLSGESKKITFNAEYIDNLDLNNAEIIVDVYDGTKEEFDNYVTDLNNALKWGGTTIVIGSGNTTNVGNVGGTIFGKPGETDTPMAYRTDLQIEGEYIIIGTTEYISLKVTNAGTLKATGMLNVVRLYGDNNEYSDSVYTANIIDLPAQGIKYYLIELKKDFFESTYEAFDCWISHCDDDCNMENNYLTVIAKKLENASGTEYDDKAIASELSSYNEVFDKYASDDLELSITLNGNSFVGMTDETANDNSHYIPNSDGTILDLTIDSKYLKTLDVGFYEYVFLFLTEKGYIDCVLNLTVEDTTPIDVRGEIAILGTPQRGETLSVDTSDLNTEELSYAWVIDGEVVSNEKEYKIGNDCLGKWITAMVSGKGLYQGNIKSASLYVDKVSRSIGMPKYKLLDSGNSIQLIKGFIVGDGTVEYGWATVNDAKAVTNWSTNDTIALNQNDVYYMFVRIIGSEIYQDATSNSVAYGVNCSLISWNVDGDVTEMLYKHGYIPVYKGSIYKEADEHTTYIFTGWDSDADGIVDIMPGADFPAVMSPVTYTAVYAKKEAALDKGLNVKGSTLSIQSDVSINYYISAAALDKYDEYYVLFAKDVINANGTVTMEYAEVRDYVVSGNYVVFSFDGIAAKELNDKIYAVVYGITDSKLYMSETDIYSVSTYAYNRIANSSNEKMVSLAVGLLNYGAAAQTYFNYNTENLANGNLSASQKEMASQSVDLSSIKKYITPENSIVAFTGASLTLEHKVAINYYFDLSKYLADGNADISNLALVIKYGDNTGVIKGDEFKQSGASYSATFDKLAAKDMRVVCSATFYLNYNTAEQLVVGETMIYSIESYAQNKQNSSDAKLVAMMKAMMHYGDAAYEYSINN